MARRNFEYDRLLANPSATVLVTGDGISVRGVITTDLVVRGGNNFSSLLEGGGEALNQSVNKIAGAYNIAASALGSDSQIPAVVVKNLQQTVKMWTGSEVPSFSIGMAFIAARAGDDVIADSMQLYSSVFPKSQSTPLTVEPPLGYTAGGKAGVIQHGGLTISFGTWFRASNMLMKSVNFTHSKETTSDGLPVFSTGTIEFEYYKAVIFSEFRQFFRSLPSQKASNNKSASKEETSFPPTQKSGSTAGSL